MGSYYNSIRHHVAKKNLIAKMIQRYQTVKAPMKLISNFCWNIVLRRLFEKCVLCAEFNITLIDKTKSREGYPVPVDFSRRFLSAIKSYFPDGYARQPHLSKTFLMKTCAM